MKTLKGTVISDKMQKTVVVRVHQLKKHAKYHKFYRRSRAYKAHDPEGEYKVGDLVVITETRPLSREKRWKVSKLLKREENIDSVAADSEAETE